jgi:two-component system, OmpR family, alkaline phosphatase synthesis response regulator PhoP
MTKTILVVDDEWTITSALVVLLKGAGYDVEAVKSGEEAIKQLSNQKPDLMILDVMMPGLDGYEVCRQVRQEAKYIPILMLTAKDELWEKVVGLELGADVYMTKPFESGELLSQVKALLRLADRMASTVDGGDGERERPLTHASLTLYPRQRRVLLNDEELTLTPKEFELLHFLMQHPRQAFGRKTLLRRVWGYEYPDDSRTVDTHVQRLRAKIEQDSTQPQFLQTIHGFGYRLAGTEK